MNALMTLMIKNMMMDTNNKTQKLTVTHMKVHTKPHNINAKSEKRLQNRQYNKRYAGMNSRFRYNNQGRSLRW